MATLCSRQMCGRHCRKGHSNSRFRIDPVPRFIQHLTQDSDHLLELRRPGDERGRELRARLASVVEAHIDPQLAGAGDEEPFDQLVPLRGSERLLRLLVLDELERLEVPVAADLADHRVLLDELLAARAELPHVALDVPDQVLPLEDGQVGERDRA